MGRQTYPCDAGSSKDRCLHWELVHILVPTLCEPRVWGSGGRLGVLVKRTQADLPRVQPADGARTLQPA